MPPSSLRSLLLSPNPRCNKGGGMDDNEKDGEGWGGKGAAAAAAATLRYVAAVADKTQCYAQYILK